MFNSLGNQQEVWNIADNEISDVVPSLRILNSLNECTIKTKPIVNKQLSSHSEYVSEFILPFYFTYLL